MNLWSKSIPDAAPDDPVTWAESVGLKCDGHRFDSSLCPQAVAPMRAMSLTNYVCQIGTYIKPIQSGGSTAAEAIAAYWSRFAYGLFLFYWQDALVASRRWKERILPMLESVDMPWAGGRDKLICEATFEKVRMRVEGVFSEQALNSDTIPYIINEEIHLWKPGHLVMSRGRQTRIWNKKAFDISNATHAKTQLQQAFEDGTMREWETACPVCNVKHAMHFRWNPAKPELGGLRWDSSTRLKDGRPNYNKLEQTIRYQFPCGHEVSADPASRRRMRGEYSEPRNEGAHLSHESWTSEAVSYDQISWLDLIKEWHGSIQSLKTGDTSLLFRFVTQRECKFYSPESLPYAGTIIYNTALKKNRVGNPNAIYRAAKADWQAGYKAKGELEHYWLIILDVDIKANSQLVWEGKCNSDSELLAELDVHEVPRVNTWLDCTGVQKKRHLQFCYQNGMHALSLDQSRKQWFLHEDKVRRFYSPGKPIHRELNVVPVFAPLQKRNMKTGEVTETPHPEEPTVVELNKAGLLANYFFIRNMKAAVLSQKKDAADADYVRIEIPDDVSEDFKIMLESWDVIPGHRGSSKDESVDGFRPRSRFDHQLMNMAYHCFELEWKLHPDLDMTLLGARLSELGLTSVEQKEETEEKESE